MGLLRAVASAPAVLTRLENGLSTLFQVVHIVR